MQCWMQWCVYYSIPHSKATQQGRNPNVDRPQNRNSLCVVLFPGRALTVLSRDFHMVPSRFAKQWRVRVGWGLENISVLVMKGPCHQRLPLINSLSESLWVIPVPCVVLRSASGFSRRDKGYLLRQNGQKVKLLKWICVTGLYIDPLHWPWESTRRCRWFGWLVWSSWAPVSGTSIMAWKLCVSISSHSLHPDEIQAFASNK